MKNLDCSLGALPLWVRQLSSPRVAIKALPPYTASMTTDSSEYAICFAGNWILLKEEKIPIDTVEIDTIEIDTLEIDTVEYNESPSYYDANYKTLLDFRYFKIYRTTKIGNQVWMVVNLNYDYNEGSAKSVCGGDNCEVYGRKYTWSAAMDSAALFSADGEGCGIGERCSEMSETREVRGVCPKGWHLPNANDWNILSHELGEDGAPTKLRATSFGGTDRVGFSVLNDEDPSKTIRVTQFATSTEINADSIVVPSFIHKKKQKKEEDTEDGENDEGEDEDEEKSKDDDVKNGNRIKRSPKFFSTKFLNDL